MAEHTPHNQFVEEEHRLTDVLLRSHAKFLSFLRSRLGDFEAAEDILQAAYLKSLERAHQLRDEESVVAWFYRLLRNAVTDHYRKAGAEARAVEAFGLDQGSSTDPEVHEAVCACLYDVLTEIPEAQAEAVRRVDLGESSVEAYAQAAGVTSNNAWVRLHRGRKALAEQLTKFCGACATHGCLDCHCRK